MNFNSQHQNNGNTTRGDAEETLRLIATLPAPKGLEERVHRTLRTAQVQRPGRLLAWTAPPGVGREWLRAAAAAAIAFVIAGGGWGVYREVQPRQTVNGIPLVSHGANAGAFAGASARRTPQTLNGPVLSGPVLSGPAPAQTGAAKMEKKKSAAQSAGGQKKPAGTQNANP